jgi:TPR repeat protein
VNYVPRHYALAIKWLKPAAIGGDNRAQFEHGWAYVTGNGIERDLRRGYA